MQEVFGDGKVVKLGDGRFGIEAVGLEHPAVLLPSYGGQPVPDLTEQVGKVLSYVAGLPTKLDGNLEEASIHVIELLQPQEEPPVSPMWCVISGNLGNPAEPNPRGDRVTGSLAYASGPGVTAWLRLTAYSYFGIADLMLTLEKGESVMAYGALETYTYKDKARLQLAVRGMNRLPRGGGDAPKPTSLMSQRTADQLDAHAFDGEPD